MMTTLVVLGGVLLSLLVPDRRGEQTAAVPILARPVAVTIDQDRLSAVIGNRFSFRSRLVNPGQAPTGALIVHLNVASLTSDVYVDPEDWSSERTLQVPPLQAGASTTLSWELQAVNAGSFAVYVVVLPDGSASTGAGREPAPPPRGRRTTDSERRRSTSGRAGGTHTARPAGRRRSAAGSTHELTRRRPPPHRTVMTSAGAGLRR